MLCSTVKCVYNLLINIDDNSNNDETFNRWFELNNQKNALVEREHQLQLLYATVFNALNAWSLLSTTIIQIVFVLVRGIVRVIALLCTLYTVQYMYSVHQTRTYTRTL